MDEELQTLQRRVTDLETREAGAKPVLPLPQSASQNDIINKLNEIIFKLNVKLR